MEYFKNSDSQSNSLSYDKINQLIDQKYANILTFQGEQQIRAIQGLYQDLIDQFTNEGIFSDKYVENVFNKRSQATTIQVKQLEVKTIINALIAQTMIMNHKNLILNNKNDSNNSQTLYNSLIHNMDKVLSLKLENLNIIDITMILQELQRLQKSKTLKINKDVFIKLKQAFINEAKVTQNKDQKYTHSLSYFLFLSAQLDFYYKDLYMYSLEELQKVQDQNKIELEMESVVLLIFSIFRLQKIMGPKNFQLELQSHKILQDTLERLIVQNLHLNLNRLESYLLKEQDFNERCTKITMTMKSLTCNQYVLDQFYNPYIKDIVKHLLQVVSKTILDCLERGYKCNMMTISNLLNALSFEIHPSSITNPIIQDLLLMRDKMKDENEAIIDPYQIILEYLLVQLNDETQDCEKSIIFLIYSLKSYTQFEQARYQLLKHDTSINGNDVIKDIQMLNQCYLSIIMQMLKSFEYLTQKSLSEFIRILFELSQKKVLPVFFMADERVQHFLSHLNLKDLNNSNRQDFLQLGHIISNSLIMQNIPSQFAERYIKILKAEYKLEEQDHSYVDTHELSQSGSSHYKMPVTLHLRELDDKAKEQYHAQKILGKITSIRDKLKLSNKESSRDQTTFIRKQQKPFINHKSKDQQISNNDGDGQGFKEQSEVTAQNNEADQKEQGNQVNQKKTSILFGDSNNEFKSQNFQLNKEKPKNQKSALFSKKQSSHENDHKV
eukprot:403337365